MDPLKGAVAKLPGLDPAPLAFAVKLVELVLFFVYLVYFFTFACLSTLSLEKW